jgi:[protein-PII] uridylyltransferase
LFAQAEQIMQRQVAPEIIYLAGLFHDIGKGRGGDHAELGAVDALSFCREIGLSDDDAELVAWLVQKHLAMSHVAQRKDINDPDVIAEFADVVGSEQRLELLYVLTMCDIRATNASLWNSWKDALLRDLYLATADFLRRGTTLSAADMAQRTREAALLRLQEQGAEAQAVHDLWRQLGAEYFNKVNAEQLVWVTTTLLHQHNPDEVLVASRQNTELGGTEIVVYVNDQDYLFAAITALLAQKKVSILSATIHTTPYGKGLDSFLVMEESGTPITDAPRLHGIQRHLAQHLRDAAKVVLNLAPGQHRRQPFELATQITIHNDDRKQRSRLELITLDRPGLLARIGAAFKYCDIVLHNAKIITLGERAEDVFVISNHELHALNHEQQQKLIHRLNSLLDISTSTKR